MHQVVIVAKQVEDQLTTIETRTSIKLFGRFTFTESYSSLPSQILFVFGYQSIIPDHFFMERDTTPHMGLI